MTYIQTLMRGKCRVGVLALLAAACLMLILLGCQNPMQRQRGTIGTVSLTFSLDMERTIMPLTGAAQFDKFEVVFSRDDIEVRYIWTYEQFAANTFELTTGDWYLVVTAFRASITNPPAGFTISEDELEDFRRSAESETIHVYVTAGENITATIRLNPITGEDYKGTFRWNIMFADGTRISSAEMVIWEYADRDFAVDTVDLLNADTYNYLILPTGEYWVVISLGSDNLKESGGISKALRVYYNMYSVMDDLEFGDADLSISPLGLILLAWDGNKWDFYGLEAWNFAVVGVAGIDDDNIHNIESAFNDVTYWNAPFVISYSAAQLRLLVDAALINMGVDEDFRNDALLYQSAVFVAIKAMVENESPVEYEWADDGHVLTVTVGDEKYFAYIVVIDFGRPIPIFLSITDAVITVVSPVTGAIPNTTASGTGNFTFGAVSWNPPHIPFQGDTEYTATIILTANDNFTFADGLTGTVSINGYPATYTIVEDGRTAMLSHTFEATVPTPPATVTSVTVSPLNVGVTRGGTQNFSATVAGSGTPPQTVIWSIDQTNRHAQTTINAGGILTVAAAETLPRLTVRATSAHDTSRSGTATVNVSLPLTENIWATGAITTAGGEFWFCFNVVAGTTYRLWWNDSHQGDGTKTMDTAVYAFFPDGTGIFARSDSQWNSPRVFTPTQSGTVRIRFTGWSASNVGTFGIVYSTGAVRPPVSLMGMVSAGLSHTVVIRMDGTLWAWGSNQFGQQGNGSAVHNTTPARIGAVTNWAAVSAGRLHTVAIRTDGTLWAWGLNNGNQIGDGTTLDRNVPTRIGTATNWVSVSAGSDHNVAIRTDGTLWVWGNNSDGQLGDGTTTARSIPVRIGTSTDWAHVSAGGMHTVGIRADGSLWAWGNNQRGQLGGGMSTSNRSIPVRIGTETDWAHVSAGRMHTVGIRADGSLWAWGDNQYGQLGDGTMNIRTSPTRIGTETDWVSVSAGNEHTIAIRADGSLWASGRKAIHYGLGNHTIIKDYGNTIARVMTPTDWVHVSVSSSWDHIVALRNDGSLWTLGRNPMGALGNGTTTHSNIPVQIIIP